MSARVDGRLLDTEAEKPRLSEICLKCLLATLQLRSREDYGDQEELRARFAGMLDEFEESCRHWDIDDEKMKRAKYALVAYIDETVLSSSWEHKEYWAARPLQLVLFERYNAGEGFFAQLEEAQEDPELLEVYYLCMMLGFRGKYRRRNQEQIQEIIDRTYASLRGNGAGGRRPLSTHGGRRDEVVGAISRRLPVWIAPAAALAIGLLFYVIMSFQASGRADEIRQTVEQLL